MLDQITTTIRDLKTAKSFDAGTRITIGPMLRRVQEALKQRSMSGRVLRGVATLRDDDKYQAVAFCELEGEESRAEEQLTSSSAWRWINQHNPSRDSTPGAPPVPLPNFPIAVDVMFAKAYSLRQPTHTIPSLDNQGLEYAGLTFAKGQSREWMMARGTTHMLVLPLRDHQSVLRGMVSVEVQARGASEMLEFWSACEADLVAWLDLTSPYLCSLSLKQREASTDPLLPVCGETMASVARLLRVFAAQEDTILLWGPTGVGKSRMARYCHARSRRAAGPFQTVDLLSVPATMQAAELYGWRKGAFTGADRDHEGYVARARGGTLFLDEIDKLSLDAQSSLLGLLESRRYRRLGDAVDREADVRFLVGTNKDLRAEVAEGRFREDLYYRVQVLAVHLPPLSKRVDEVVPWAEHMLERRAEEADSKRAVSFAAEARALLHRARWPGNLRQLDNVVRRAFVMALADSESDAPLIVEAAHVEASLAPELSNSGPLLSKVLAESAQQFVAACERGVRLDLDDAAIFRAHVLAAAIGATGDLESALRLLGRDNLIKNRNHHKTVARERERVREFHVALGESAPDWLIATLTR